MTTRDVFVFKGNVTNVSICLLIDCETPHEYIRVQTSNIRVHYIRTTHECMHKSNIHVTQVTY